MTNELDVMRDTDRRAADYLAGVATRRAYPDAAAVAGLAAFDEAWPSEGRPAEETLALLDTHGSPATTASNGPNYFGFVIGASLPAAAAAERLMIAWDQCASTFANSPVAATLEAQAARWVLEALDLPRSSAVGFGTSATACTLACLSAARRSLLARLGWDFDQDGLIGAPEIKVVVSEMAHITVLKALRLLGFGMGRLVRAPVDACGRIDPERFPAVDASTLVCLQAGEVNTGEFDPFAILMPQLKAAGAWVHVDGAFGLWARASDRLRGLTDGIDGADSWTTDGHKWLNTPYDGAMAICRDADALAAAMNSDAAYLTASKDAQKNLTLEFSRRARGIPIWAALRTLGKAGVERMVERHCDLAQVIAEGLRAQGFEVLNRVALNQVLARGRDDAHTLAIRQRVEDGGAAWFGNTVWQGRPALRISVSSWRTEAAHVDRLLAAIAAADRA